MNPTLERTLQISHPLARVLAPLDALLMPGVILYCVKTMASSGGAAAAFFGVIAICWAMAGLVRAVFDFEHYRWMTLRLAKWALIVGGLGAAMKLVWWIQG